MFAFIRTDAEMFLKHLAPAGIAECRLERIAAGKGDICEEAPVNGWSDLFGSEPRIAARRGGRLSLVIRRMTDVTLQHLFGIVLADVAMRKNTTSAAIHSSEGRP